MDVRHLYEIFVWMMCFSPLVLSRQPAQRKLCGGRGMRYIITVSHVTHLPGDNVCGLTRKRLDEETGIVTATNCSSDSDCPGRKSHCFMNNCVCEPGLFLNLTNQSCSETCNASDLATEFVEYPDSVLHGFYLDVREGLSLQDCMALCLNTSSCLAFSFRATGGRCLPHEATALKAPSLWCPTSSKGWSHYQRTCDAARQIKSCQDRNKTEGLSGVYSIQLTETREKLRVWCDMDSGDGGWLVFQRRRDGSVDFYRNWTQYEDGFGNITGEFWLGLSRLHRLTKGRPSRLRVDLGEVNGHHHYAEYSSFSVGGPETNYTLTLSGYSGTAGDSMEYQNNQSFTTYDRDNDKNSDNCAASNHGAWWYKSCHNSHLNGRYKADRAEGLDGITWVDAHNDFRSFTVSEMKVQPV